MRCCLVVLLLATACHREVAGGKADGPAVFAETCARCHGAGGQPTDSNMKALGVRDLTSPEFQGRATAELVANQVRNGSSNGVMPPFAGALTDAQIEAVAQYVLTLGK